MSSCLISTMLASFIWKRIEFSTSSGRSGCGEFMRSKTSEFMSVLIHSCFSRSNHIYNSMITFKNPPPLCVGCFNYDKECCLSACRCIQYFWHPCVQKVLCGSTASKNRCILEKYLQETVDVGLLPFEIMLQIDVHHCKVGFPWATQLLYILKTRYHSS